MKNTEQQQGTQKQGSQQGSQSDTGMNDRDTEMKQNQGQGSDKSAGLNNPDRQDTSR